MLTKKPRILILEPYYGGSHRSFLEGLQNHIRADFTQFTLPARHWKMRMQLSAVWFIEKLKELPVVSRYFDTVLCSSFVDVAVFRAMLFQVAGWNRQARILTYFHENQFAYPQRFADSSPHQFTAINVHSALASDGVAFNSLYNQQSFFAGCRSLRHKTEDMNLPQLIKTIKDKSRILYPGIDFTEIDKRPWKRLTKKPVIVWNHRWEHDKDPGSFFRALAQLQERNLDFQAIILGQSFTDSPSAFAGVERQFGDKIIHLGFARTIQQYADLLCSGDFVVSTARHEFYGIAVIEAVRAGCLPILPDRLAYPELFDKRFRYGQDSLVARLEEVLTNGSRLGREEARSMTDRFSWGSVSKDYAAWFFNQ